MLPLSVTISVPTHPRLIPVWNAKLAFTSYYSSLLIFEYNIGSRPRLDQLQLMKDSSEKTIRIMEKVAPIWSSRFAPALGFDHSRIKIIEADYRHSAEEACREMFTRWLDGDHDLQPPTWDTLVHSLMCVGLVDEARTLKDMIRH